MRRPTIAAVHAAIEKRHAQVFLYEHMTGGGLLKERQPLKTAASLVAEGRAMRAALTEDFAAAGIEVVCLCDANQEIERPGVRCVAVGNSSDHDVAFDRLATTSDWTIVVAPEIGGVLGDLCRRVGSAGGRLLGGSLPFIELASDKHATAVYLANAGLRVPPGIEWTLGKPWPISFGYPAVFKPLDGAGSEGVQMVPSAVTETPEHSSRGRLERFCRGIAASVAFLCGPYSRTGLPPCRQLQSDDGRFRYLGGSFDLSPAMAKRAAALAERAVRSLPEPLGYLGVDLVLGDHDDGRDDFVIEINPRLTTSYVGLRAACGQNLAAAMLAIAMGEPYHLSFTTDSIEFSADGKVGIAHHRS